MIELNKLNCILITPKHSLNNTIMFILPPLKICNRQFCNIISKNYGICLGTSSACQTNKYSHVLSAMNIDENYKYDLIIITPLSPYKNILSSLNSILNIKHCFF